MIKQIYRSLFIASVSLFLIGLSASKAQAQVVKGKVTDESGQALPGVNIIKKGTTIGTATDGDGTFSLQASEGDILVASFIGYASQEIAVNSQTNFNIVLKEDVSTLQEVIVKVPYGESKRSDLASAQSTISAKDIDRTVNTTIEQAIQGRAAGVYVTQNTGQPGGGISVSIRGVSTIGGSNEPLYVIDGVQIQVGQTSYGASSSSNPLAGINPADIQTMDILQGPSATALYGSRGTNGVVLITTKRGKAGEAKISYTFQHSIQTPPKELPVMNLQQYAELVNAFHPLAGGNSPAEYLDPSLLGKGTDWQKELFRTVAMNKHQLTVSGGSDKSTYYMSGEYFKQDGVAIGSAFNRYSFRANLDTKPREGIAFGANLNFNQTNDKLTATNESTIQNALTLTPQIPVKNLDGTWGGPDVLNGATIYAPINPIAIANLVTNNLVRRTFIGGLNGSVKIIKGLTFSSQFNTNLNFGNSTNFRPSYSIGYSTNVSPTLTEGSTLNTWWSWNQQLSYVTQIGKHSINVIAVHEAQENTYKNVSGTRTGFLTNDIIDLQAGDPVTGARNDGGSGSGGLESYLGRAHYIYGDRYIVDGAIRTDGSSNFGPQNKWGVFPSLSLGWRISHEAFFHVPFISDLKLRFETGLTGNQGQAGNIYSPLTARATPWGSGFLPGTYGNPGLKWEQTNTVNYGINIGLLDNRIQLEFDYFIKKTDNLLLPNPTPWYLGTTGNGAPGQPTVNFGSMQNKGFGLALNTVNVNKGAFKWETNFNISSFNTKVTALYSANAFVDRVTTWENNWTQRAAIGQAPWLFRGYVEQGLFQSVDDIKNSATPVDNNGNKFPVDQTNNGIWVGDVKYKDISGPNGVPDGIIDGYDQTNIGNPWPKFYGGITNSFSYKGFDLSVLVTYNYGNDIYNYLAQQNTNPNSIYISRNFLVHAMDFARPVTNSDGTTTLSNPGTDVPRVSPGANGNFSRQTTKFVEDGSYIRVKNISLTYHVPTSLLSKQHVIKNVRLTAGAQNIKTFTHYSGYDPEVGAYVGNQSSGTTQSIGLDYGRYPLTPVYTFTVGVDF